MGETTVSWAAPGRATVAAVAAAVRELQGANPLRSVLVVTPPGFTASALRRLLPSIDGRGIAGIRFTTLPDLALDLAPEAVRLQRPVTPLLLTAAVHEQLEHHCPEVLQPVRHHAATVDALAQAAERLRSLPLADDPAAAVADLAQGSDVRRAIVSLAGAARLTLRAKGYRDEALVLAAARGALADGTSLVPAPVVAVCTDTFHPAQLPLLRTVLAAAPASAVVACPPAPDDAGLIEQLRDLTGVEPPQRSPDPPARVVSCPDHDEEVRWVVRSVVGQVTGPDSPAPDQIAVVYPPGSRYGRSVRDELERAGLVTSGPTIETLAGSTAGQALRLLLDAFDEGCDREHVLHVVAVAPQWPTGEGRRRNATRWRRLCREAGIVTAADWGTARERLEAAQRARRERRATFDASVDPSTPSERDEWDLEAIDRLAGLAQRMIGAAGDYGRARTWAEAADAIGRELARHIGDEAWREQHWADVPVWQRRAAEQVGTLLAALTQFDHPDAALPFGRAELRRVVTAELDRPVRRVGDTVQGIRVLPLQHGICLDARFVYVVGVNDGVLPPRRTDDLVVPRDLPASTAAVVEHADWHRDRLHRAWRALLAGGAHVTATFARTDLRRGGTVYPSLWLQGLDHDHHASHAAGVRTLPPLTAAEAAARRGERSLGASSALHRRAIALASRSLPDPTVFDGWIGPHPEHDPRAGVQAITGFEAHAKCALSYFIERVLRVDTGTDPSEITEIEPLTKGDLVHHVLETVVGEWLALDQAARPAWLQGTHLDAVLQRATDVLDERAEVLQGVNLLGHPRAWAIERDVLLSALATALRKEAEAGLTPLAVEYAFGDPDSAPAFPVEIGDGDTVRFRGRVDRVDRTDAGLLVTDFKSSRAAAKPSIKRADVREGRRLQLPLYAKVVTANAAALGIDEAVETRSRYVYIRRDTSDVVDCKDEVALAFDVIVPHTAGRMIAGDFRPSAPDEWGSAVVAPDGLGLGDLAARAGLWSTAPVFPDDQPAQQGTDHPPGSGVRA